MTERLDPNELLEQAQQDAESIIDYRPGDSFVHGRNPVTKLVLVIGIAAIAFMLPTFRLPLAIMIALLAVAAVSGVFIPVAKVTVVIGVPLLLILLPVQALFYPQNQTPMYVFEGVPVVDQLTVWREGVMFSLLILSRLAAVIVAMMLFVTTTLPRKLTDSLMQKGMSNKFAYVFIAALQFIPQMQRRSGKILDAQQARGLDTSANVLRRGKAIVELLSPLLISTLISTQTRALALESRGFTRGGERTYIYDIPDTTLDRALRWAIGVAVVAVAVWRVAL
jgi:energy-coupling factor transport system permease protein